MSIYQLVIGLLVESISHHPKSRGCVYPGYCQRLDAIFSPPAPFKRAGVAFGYFINKL